MTAFELWFYLVALPGLDHLGAGIVLLSIIATIAATFTFFIAHDQDGYKDVAKIAWRCIPISALVFLVSAIVTVLLPNERQIYKIIGGYVVTNIEGVEKLPPNLVGAANAFLEQYRETAE